MDVGNIVGLEHVNVQIPDQRLATIFYVMGLGLTRDPYLMTGITNMWINIGRSQFHMPTGKPQVLRGQVGLVIADRAALLERLGAVRTHLADTRFDFREADGFVEATSPWGNRIRVHEPAPEFGPIQLGMPYVEFEVPEGSAAGIARFYHEVLGAPAEVDGGKRGPAARVTVGVEQHLVFRETSGKLPDYDGHHIQVYVGDFTGSRDRLKELGLVTEYSNRHQYRFNDIIDLDRRRVLFTIEHEIRAVAHPLYARPLVNRNPRQTNVDYVPGQDALAWQRAEWA